MVASTAEQICLACNMCCNGMLFAKVKLTPQEGTEHSAERDEDGPHFPHPCANLCSSGACDIYEARPGECRAYHCDLLDKLNDGLLSKDAALEIIGRAYAYHNMTIQACLSAMPGSERRVYQDAALAFAALVNIAKSKGNITQSLMREAVFQWNVCRTYMRTNFEAKYCVEEMQAPPPAPH